MPGLSPRGGKQSRRHAGSYDRGPDRPDRRKHIEIIMNADYLPATGADAESAPMLNVLEDLVRDPRTPIDEIYAYIDFCMDAFATSPHARQIRAALTLVRNGVVSRRVQLGATGENALA